jgi:hypothetical protein
MDERGVGQYYPGGTERTEGVSAALISLILAPPVRQGEKNNTISNLEHGGGGVVLGITREMFPDSRDNDSPQPVILRYVPQDTRKLAHQAAAQAVRFSLVVDGDVRYVSEVLSVFFAADDEAPGWWRNTTAGSRIAFGLCC